MSNPQSRITLKDLRPIIGIDEYLARTIHDYSFTTDLRYFSLAVLNSIYGVGFIMAGREIQRGIESLLEIL
jgi:hypothetical protein